MEIATTVSMLMALSVATERLVEIIKGVVPFFNKDPNANLLDPKAIKKENLRKAALQVLAILAGIATAYVAQQVNPSFIPENWRGGSGTVVIGLLASGGSGFWNSILTYIIGIKDLKMIQIRDKKTT